jgi:hypothetical protein
MKRSQTAHARLICDNFLYSFKGAPSARQADRARPCSQRPRDMYEEALDEPGDCAEAARSDGESRRRWRGSLARCL